MNAVILNANGFSWLFVFLCPMSRLHQWTSEACAQALGLGMERGVPPRPRGVPSFTERPGCFVPVSCGVCVCGKQREDGSQASLRPVSTVTPARGEPPAQLCSQVQAPRKAGALDLSPVEP